MSLFSRCIAALVISGVLLSITQAQTATVIPANEAAAHVGEYATVEGVVAKVFTANNPSVPQYVSKAVIGTRSTRPDSIAGNRLRLGI